METKICRRCAEEIKVAAKVCRHCGGSQAAKVLDLGALSPLILVALLFGTFFVSARLLIGEKDFSGYHERIAILNSTAIARRNSSGSYLEVIGLLTNSSAVAWKNLDFELRLFDSQGALVDTRTSPSSFSLPAHADHVFNVEFWPGQPLPPYQSYKLAVYDAHDASVPW